MKNFRIWSEKHNCFVYFTFEDLSSLGNAIAKFPTDYIKDNPEYLQFGSGKFNSNNEEVYQGDIISLINEAGIETRVICEFGSAKRDISGATVNRCEIVGFYFRIANTNIKTFPIVHNYLGVNDFEIFNKVGNILDNHE